MSASKSETIGSTDQGHRKSWQSPSVRRIKGKDAENGIFIGPEVTLILS